MKAPVYLDNGFYKVTAWHAARLVGGAKNLPRHGYEKRVTYNGQLVWLTRIWLTGKVVWAIYNAAHNEPLLIAKSENGQ